MKGDLGGIGLLHVGGARTIQALLNLGMVRPEFKPMKSSHRNYYFNCHAGTSHNKNDMCIGFLGLP